MEILNSTNQYIEELGEKVSIQKKEVAKINLGGQRKKKKGPDDMDEDLLEDEQADEENEQNQNDEDNLDENEKIKHNLKNSSKVYLNITHSI